MFMYGYTNSQLLESDKSTTQKMSDSTSSGKGDAEETSKTYLQSAQETVAGAAGSVSDTLQGTYSPSFSSLSSDLLTAGQAWLTQFRVKARSRVAAMIP